MTIENIKSSYDDSVAGTYARFPICIESGKGSLCYDIEGKEYIDFTTGIGVNSLGFCDDGWSKTVADQAAKLNHISNLYYTLPGVELATALCRRTGYSNLFYSNSGAEANEGAIKAARKYSYDKYGENRNQIITLINSFHGRTITTLSATGQDYFHNYFFPFTEGFLYCPAGDINALKDMLTDKVCAVMIEFVQGEGGVIKLDPEYVNQLFKLCSEKDILVVADEVQTGIGRTGKLLASQHYDVQPDITTLAKGLAGGLPIGAVLFNEKTKDVLSAGTHGSTFGGNPISAAAALYTINTIDDELLSQVTLKAEHIKRRLLAMKHVNAVDGLGLMIGIDVYPLVASDILKSAIDKGLLLLTAKDKVRLLPPLNISMEVLDRGLDIIEELLS